MIKQGRGGSVVNISSTTSFQSMANMSGYIASKGAMNSTTRSMAVEYGQFGIRVNAVVLGLILTNDNSKAMRSEEHTSELPSLMRTSYAVSCLKKKKKLS